MEGIIVLVVLAIAASIGWRIFNATRNVARNVASVGRKMNTRLAEAVHCKGCGTGIPTNFQIECDECGFTKTRNIASACPNCGRKAGWVPCPECGESNMFA